MRIGIIGGGASGIISAYLLSFAHEVHLFEKCQILGGNIRTLNANVDVNDRVAGLRLENGVLGFHRRSYPIFHRLLDRLNVPYSIKQPTTSLFRNGRYLPSRPQSFINAATLMEVLRSPSYLAEFYHLLNQFTPVMRALVRSDPRAKADVGESLRDIEPVSGFIRSLLCLAFSAPYSHTQSLPLALVRPYLRSLRKPDWSRIDGGVYAYQEAILDQSDFTTHLNQGDVCVTRDPGQIRVRCRDGDIAVDRLIIATTPGAVNRVLRDADDAENACFAPWQDQIFKTVSHTSLAPYGAFQHVAKSPMDMFLSEDGLSGYNTYLNGFYDIAPSTPYSFAYGLDRLIDPADILDVQDHTVPVYTPSAYAQKERILAMNGHRDTYYVGAYLGNGLHEGAAESALRVSQLLGGEHL